MALRTILTQGDPALGKVCRRVEKFDDRLHTLLDDMRETLANADGVGLAAPQIGILRRVVVVLDQEENAIELINPVIIHEEGEQTGLEGCLSVPGMYGTVVRPYKVTVQAQDRNGNTFEAEGEDLVARCFCHELEHLDGHLFVEHTDRLYTVEELEAMDAQNKAGAKQQ
jgi:peptide deformylase